MQVILGINERCIPLDFNHMWLNHDWLLTKYSIYKCQILEPKTQLKSLSSLSLNILKKKVMWKLLASITLGTIGECNSKNKDRLISIP